jgi:sterol desaturase/sphingolipid hydroxylase (fatty acid hydroxylase superfamily)
MKRSHSSNSELLAWLSFAVFLLAFLAFGSVFIYRTVPPLLGYDMSGPVSPVSAIAILAFGVLSVAVLVYLAAILWLLFAKLFFSRHDVSKVVFAGPTTRFDRWLVDTLFPLGIGKSDGGA